MTYLHDICVEAYTSAELKECVVHTKDRGLAYTKDHGLALEGLVCTKDHGLALEDVVYTKDHNYTSIIKYF